MARSLSKEQDRAATPGRGVRIVVANAGSGKTTTGAELFRRLLLAERAKRFPGGEQLTAEQVKGLLGLFFLTSFTVKQAEDLNRTAKEILREEGLPIPTSHGKEIRICRTLDSHLHGWLRKRAAFHAWCGMHGAWPASFAQLVDCLSPKARDYLRIGRTGEALEGKDQLLKFFYATSHTLAGEMQTMIAESLVRSERGPKLPPELEPGALVADFHATLGQVDPEQPEWGLEFWTNRTGAWRADHRHHSDLYHHLEARTAHADPHAKREAKTLATTWWKSTKVADRFLNLYQIARSRGYDPLHRSSLLGSQAFLEAFASAEGVEGESVESFHRWATDYVKFKRRTALLDFGDTLEAHVSVLRACPWFLQQKEDDPSWGFRFKYSIWDEKQDFTPRQNTLVDLMAPPADREGMSLIIGDGKQSIYLFAGASPYDFSRMVKNARADGDNVYTLTKSFRSARRIVDLGNEVAATLPSYAASVLPSVTDYAEDGELAVSPPLMGEEDEASWIIKRIDALLKAGEMSIMVLMRNDPRDHAIAVPLRDPKYKSVQLLTIHKSKGLEARHVFVAGCTAGQFPIRIGDTLGRSYDERQQQAAAPDRRLFNDQECNLVYVAVTRARWSLTFSIPVMAKVSMGAGTSRDEWSGPSPIFSALPTLQRLCLDAGWKANDLAKGVKAHEEKVETFYNRFNGRIWGLNQEAKSLGLKPGSGDPRECNDREDTVALGVHELLRESGGGHRFQGAPMKPVASAGADGKEAALKRFKASFFSNGSPPKKVGNAEREIGFREGWIEMGPAGAPCFTESFKQLFRAG